MSTFPMNNAKLDNLSKKMIKYMVIGLLLLGIGCMFLYFMKNYLNQEFFGTISIIMNSIYENLLNIIIILLFCVPTLLFLKFMYQKNKFIMYIFLSIFVFFILSVFVAFYVLGIKNFSIFPMIGTIFLYFFNSVNNFLPFILILPFIIFFYYRKLKTNSFYKLTNLKIKNHILLIDDGKKKIFKALTILQIQNIPKNIIVKEERSRKKNIEKLMIPGNLQYLHYHLTSLAKIIPNISFEIRVLNNDIKLRFILSSTGTEINQLINKIVSLKDIVITVFQTTFPGLKFELLQGNQLKTAWGDIFGGWGSYRIKFFEKNKIKINKIVEKTFLSILKFEDIPIFKISNNKSQIDSLIRGLIGSHLELNYIIFAKPMEICNFEKQKHIIEKKAENIGQKAWSKSPSGNFEFRVGKTLKDKIQEEEIREELLNIRHAEITGMWNVSGYVVVRSDDIDKLDNDIQKVKALISTIFGIELKILESNNLQKGFSAIPMRSNLFDPLNMSSEQLAIFLHLPEDPIPSLSRIDIPEFEIPPERRITNGISLGKILFYDQEMYPFQLTIEDLRLNTFICGLIGMGKTRLSMNILKQLTNRYPNINWICLDWKGEYQFLLNEIKSQKIRVLIPGSDTAPVKLNMFDPQRSNTDEHSRKLFAMIREIFKSEFTRQNELSSQMETVCKEVLRRVVKNPNMRNLNSFIKELNNYAKENQANNRTIMMTVTALINRFDKFRHGVLKKVFDVKKSNIDFDLLMENKLVINLNYLLTNGGTKTDVRFLMNLILKYVIDKALGRGITDTLKHIVLIEDSQFLIPSVFREVPETSLVEDIPLLLRGVGESLITIATRPEVSSDIIANSGVKITFKSPYDSQKIAKYQNLSDVQEKYLRILPKREAIVTLPNFQFPFRIFTDYFEYQKGTDLEIIGENIISMDFNQSSPQTILERRGNFQNMGNPINSDLNNDVFNINTKKIVNSKETIGIQKQALVENKSIINRREIQEDKQKLDLNPTTLLSKIQQILKLGPQNKKALSNQLSIQKNKLDKVLKFFIDHDIILTCLAPIFSKKAKQKLYLLPENKNWVKNEIKLRLENDFLKNGKIGKLAEEDNFDYVWYGNNSYLKILYSKEDFLNLDKISKLILKWFEEAIEREIFELIIIVPFYDWGEIIRSWLKAFNSNQILIFSYNIDDWNKLSEYFNNGIHPEWNHKSINLENSKFKDDISLSLKNKFSIFKEPRRFQSNLNYFISPKSIKKKQRKGLKLFKINLFKRFSSKKMDL